MQILEWWAAIDDGTPYRYPHQCSYNGDCTPQTTFRIICHLVYLSLLSELDRYGFDMDERIFNHGGGNVVGLFKGNLGQANMLV